MIHVAQFRGIIGRTSVVSHYRPRKGNYKNRPSGTTGPGRTIATSSTIVMGAPKSSSSSRRKCVSEEKDFRTSTSATNPRSIIWSRTGPGRVGCDRERIHDAFANTMMSVSSHLLVSYIYRTVCVSHKAPFFPTMIYANTRSAVYVHIV